MKINNTIYPILIIITLLFNSCVSVKLPSAEISKNIEMSGEEGIVIGAISIDNRNYTNAARFFYGEENISKDAKLSVVSIVPPQTWYVHFKPDLFDGNKAVHYFKIKKLKGKYKFYARTTFKNGVQYAETMKYKLNAPFEIEKGKIKYIGEINCLYDHSYEVNDKSERDLPKLKKMFPTINIEK